LRWRLLCLRLLCCLPLLRWCDCLLLRWLGLLLLCLFLTL